MASIYGSSSVVRSKPALALCAAALLTIGVSGAVPGGPRFYADDPIWIDDDAALDASKVVKIEDAGSYDFVVNTFSSPGRKENIRALNVNTLDEVPDSSWFTNRIGRTDMSLADLRRGPDRFDSISLEGWVVSAGKGTGVQPGFRMTAPDGQLFQVEFDPISNPEMATGAEIIGTAFYHAFGYNTVDVYLAELDPECLEISKKATIWDPLVGKKRPMVRRDVDDVLRRAARQPNGKYRVLASRFADGKPLGNFRYYGTRPDDPNDIVPHEHRRELRGARVFGAWLNHDDSRGVNSLDMLVTRNRIAFVKHYMFDFGSTLGSGTVYAQRHRPGNEYMLEWKPGWLTLATMGLHTRPWMRIDYPRVPASIGRFEADAFNAADWKPEYPNPAFANMRADDAFWAARIVAAFTDDRIRAIVEKARYSDPRATDYMVATLAKRRDKVVKEWLPSVNPLIDFSLSPSGELTFRNAAVDAGIDAPPRGYRVQWARYYNAAGAAATVGEAMVTDLRAQAPASVTSAGAAPEYVEVRLSAVEPARRAWETPVTVHFRRAPNGWALVGVRRAGD
jgi:hypothetical protein